MSKHTPGPWYAVEYAGYWSIQSVEVYSESDQLNIEKDPNAEANAKLMAAAPYLLEACELALSLLQMPSNEVTKADLKEIENAIKKATE